MMEFSGEQFDQLPCPHRPLSFRDIVVAGFRLTVATIGRSGVAAFVVLLPLFLLFGEVARAFFIDASSALADAARSGAAAAADEQMASAVATLAGSSVLLNLVFFFVLVALVLAQTAITVDSWDRALAEETRLLPWLGRTLGRPFWSVLVQLLLMIALFVVTTMAALLLDFTVGGAAGAGGSTAVWIAYFAGGIFLVVATVFRVHEIVADDRGPWHSLVSSIALVHGHWFKALAVVLMIGIIYQALSIAVSMTLLPSGGADIPLTSDLTDTRAVARAWGLLGRLMTPTFMAASGAVMWLTLVIGTNMITALYIDLRARRGDFDPEAEDSYPRDDESTFDEDETRD